MNTRVADPCCICWPHLLNSSKNGSWSTGMRFLQLFPLWANDISIIRHQNVWERRSVVTHRCGEQRLPRPAADAGYWRIRCSLKFTVSRPGQFTQTANYKTNWLMLTWCCFAHENTTNGPAGAFSVTDLNECRSGAAVYHTYYRNHMFKRIYLRTNVFRPLNACFVQLNESVL